MLIVITEQIAHVAHDVDAAHADWVVSLSEDDRARAHLGYAVASVAFPTARRDGVAVMVGDAATAPDTARIRVRDAATPDPSDGAFVVRRRALPVMVRVGGDQIAVLRRIQPPGTADDRPVPTRVDDTRPGTADDATEE